VLITKEKKPNVISVIGKPKILKIGFTNPLSSESTKANMQAVVKSEKCTPDKNLVSTNATTDVIISLII
jgi:hypothetical protein